MIRGNISHQKLDLASCKVVSDSIDYLTAEFTFSPDWYGAVKVAHFSNGSDTYDIILTDDRIRPEDHLNLSAGNWSVYLHGNIGDTRITTDAQLLRVHRTGTLNGEPLPEIPLSAAEQILHKAANAEEFAQSVVDRADAGEFIGPPGPEGPPGKVDEGTISKAVEDYLDEHPIEAPVQSVNGQTGNVQIAVPTKVSQLQNDAGYLTQHQDISGKQDKINDLATIRAGAAKGATALQSESDPTVPSWAKQANKPTYTAAEVHALPDTTVIPDKLPSPGTLTLTGAVSASYDGSNSVTVDIPQGGGSSDPNVVYLQLTDDGTVNKALIEAAAVDGAYVKLIKGDYPLDLVTVVESATLDLCGSKLTMTGEKNSGALIVLSGMNPKICNGELVGTYWTPDDDPSYVFHESEGLIRCRTHGYENAVIENIDAHNCWGYAIAEGYGRQGTDYERVYSGASATDVRGTNTSGNSYVVWETAALDVSPGYKYVHAMGGIGYNRIISYANVGYYFYDSDGNEIGTASAMPRINVVVPDGAVKFKCRTSLPATSDFLAYYTIFSNCTARMTISKCRLHNNHSLGISGGNGMLDVYDCEFWENGKPYTSAGGTSRATTGGIDIEDNVTPIFRMSRCRSRNESKLGMIGAYNAIISDCVGSQIIIYRGWTALISNCKCNSIGTFDSNTPTNVRVVNCELGDFNAGPNTTYENCTLNHDIGGAYDNLHLHSNFTIQNHRVTNSIGNITGRLVGRIVSDTQSGYRFGNMSTAPGSHLVINSVVRSNTAPDGSNNYYGAINVTGDCYGLDVDHPVYANGHIIADSALKATYKYANFNRKNNDFAGIYRNCVIDTENAPYFNKNGGNYGAEPTAIRFENCVIKNSVNSLFSVNPPADSVTIVFSHCDIADRNSIVPNPSQCSIVFDDGSGGGAVDSVNGKTGTVVLTAYDVGALPSDTPIPAPVTDDHINDLIDAKLTPIEALADDLAEVVGA